MQENGPPLEQSLHHENSHGRSQQDSSVCSNSTFSDSGSWDTDFDDDYNSESSGLYGDVAERRSCNVEVEGQPKSASQSRVAALAKTVAASLAASSSTSSVSVKPTKPFRTSSDFYLNQVSVAENGRGTISSKNTSPRSVSHLPSKPLPKPPVPCRPAAASPDPHPNKLIAEDKKIAGQSHGCTTLPKPPGPTSEQVQQVIGALGHLWPSDSISLSSQTQSDDDYEPIQSDSSPQMGRLSQENALRSHLHLHSSSPPAPAPAPAPVGTSPTSQGQGQGFLHSPAAAAALAAAAASAVATRLSQGSGSGSRRSGSGSGSSASESNTYGSGSQHSLSSSRLYEPVQDKNKVSGLAQRSYLYPAEKSEKADGKRVPGSSPQRLQSQQEQRPPVPNRPLPPTPKPSDGIRVGGSVVAGLENQPWFHNVDRKQAELIIKNGPDGYFLIRPSSQSQNLLTLTLLFNQRVYNISVRQRTDGRIALGFEKPDEQSFDSIEEMVLNYQSENLLLFSRNERPGRTVLTKSPPKQRLS